MTRRRPPKIAFQDHIAAFLIREHKFGVLERGEIADTDHTRKYEYRKPWKR